MRAVPQQQRSRERLERVLDAAEAVLAEDGYDGFSTTTVAGRAGVPPSTVYRWFADKDELAAAILMRHLDHLDENLRATLERLDEGSLREVVRAIHDVYVDYYRLHPSHVILWFEGRAGRTTVQEVHRHTGQLVSEMRAYAMQRSLLSDSITTVDVRLMAEAVDRIHEYAFREDRHGDPGILARGLALAQDYFERLSST